MDNVLSERVYKAGYVVKTVLIDGSDYGGRDFEMKKAYTPDGGYIGNSKWAYRLCKTRGIKPEKSKETHNVCSIGFCEKEQKWYGWSHRAMYGFGVGSKVKAGDCAYVPTDEEDFRKDCLRFWDDDGHDETGAAIEEQEGVRGVQVDWVYGPDIPNKKIRGRNGGAFTPFPDSFGRGEWVAKTMEDAKQMATDFANDVS